MSTTAIEWTEATWNPVTGCDRVSPGCAHCYALDLAARLKAMGQARYQRDGDPRTSGPGFGVTLHEDKLEEPLRWRKPRVVFVNSMSDLFHEEVPFDFIDRVYRVMGACPQHTFQVLTKRPERALEWQRRHEHQLAELGARPAGEPWPNVWLGVSIENRRFVHRAGVLRQIEVAVRFISAEPLLGPLIPTLDPYYSGLPRWADRPEQTEDPPPGLDLAGIDWLICGGESGPRARPLNLDWARDLRDACQAAGVAYFFKQVGGRTPKSGGRELDGRTWDEMPAAVAHA